VRSLILLAVLGASCASAPDEPNACFVREPEIARAIGAAILRLENPNGPNVHVQDRGRHWLVGEWIEDLQTDDEVLLGFGGRSVEIDKCSGRLSNLRSWR